MKKDCSTCICKEGSCYPSTTIFDKDKTCRSYSPDYEGYIAELEKENAELKVFKKDCVKLTEANVVMARQRAETSKQLTKAKNLLAKWVELFKPKGGNFPPTPIQVDTEQFLNSEVEK